MNNDVNWLTEYDESIKYQKDSVLMIWIRLVMINFTAALSPLVFLLYNSGGMNFYIILAIFLCLSFALRKTYVRASNRRKVQLYILTQMKLEKKQKIQSIFRV